MAVVGFICIGILVGLATLPIHLLLTTDLVTSIIIAWATGIVLAIALVWYMAKER